MKKLTLLIPLALLISTIYAALSFLPSPVTATHTQPLPITLSPITTTIGSSHEGSAFFNLNNTGSGQELVLAYGKDLLCQKETATTGDNDWIHVTSINPMSPDINPFPLCVWPKGEYQSKSCVDITYVSGHVKYDSPDDFPTSTWIEYFAVMERCTDGEGMYLPAVTNQD